MKKLLRVAMLVSTLATIPSAHASWGQGTLDTMSTKASFALTAAAASIAISPVLLLKCEIGRAMGGEESCDNEYRMTTALSTAAFFLLRDIDAAQPDALRHVIDGEEATPLLKEVVQRLQDFSREELDQELTREQALADIIVNV